MNLTSLSATKLRTLVKKKEIKAQEIILAYLKRIKEQEKDLSAFITVLGEKALASAKSIDRKRDKGKLAGIPVAVKDNILTKGIRTTCASKMLEKYVPPYSATVVNKLEEEDAVVIGKTNLDEFGMGSSTENSAFFPTRNPWDLRRVPGGSSGGSAAAVAAGEAAASLGSDTGGSVRQPAAFCGLVGLKPTYSRVSRYGLVAFASSLDQIGPLTRTVADNALLTQIIAGSDPQDSTVSSQPVPDYRKEMRRELPSPKAAYLKDKVLDGIDPEVKDNYYRTLSVLEETGAELREMDFPSWEYALACYYLIAPSEASSNLSRYDGVRYSFRHPRYSNLKEMYLNTRSEGFGREVKRRILLGTFALSSGYYDDYYLKAAQARKLICQEFEKAFKKVDFILTPTAPEPAFLFGEKEDPVAMYLSDIFTVTANLAGIPALTMPVGLSQKGLPIGIQIMASFFQESCIFKLAFLLEKKVKFDNNKLNLRKRRSHV
ncbi:MAG: Asp-tRNA(Asn)/Glu-tRNA(Gln) amidotransferase subunit GatA [Candidatus Aminicenantes bacterium]|nr:Asp-tRNA(Asn)/Glu-tRNA(Gln) amidotransferase subunit GatA [Candidatus Aminicenantes bacterium]